MERYVNCLDHPVSFKQRLGTQSTLETSDGYLQATTAGTFNDYLKIWIFRMTGITMWVSKLLESWAKTRCVDVMSFHMVPLLDGTLVSTLNQDIYFPEDMEGRLIPADLDINIVQNSAAEKA